MIRSGIVSGITVKLFGYMVWGKGKFKKKAVVEMTEEQETALRNRLVEINNNITALRSLDEPDQEIIEGLINEARKVEGKINNKKQNKMNASKHFYDGDWYDSRREADFCRWLKAQGLVDGESFQRQAKFELVPAFELEHEKVLAMTIAVDYVINDCIIVDIKGMVTEDFKLRWKFLKYTQGNDYTYFLINNLNALEMVKLEIQKTMT